MSMAFWTSSTLIPSHYHSSTYAILCLLCSYLLAIIIWCGPHAIIQLFCSHSFVISVRFISFHHAICHAMPCHACHALVTPIYSGAHSLILPIQSLSHHCAIVSCYHQHTHLPCRCIHAGVYCLIISRPSVRYHLSVYLNSSPPSFYYVRANIDGIVSYASVPFHSLNSSLNSLDVICYLPPNASLNPFIHSRTHPLMLSHDLSFVRSLYSYHQMKHMKQ